MSLTFEQIAEAFCSHRFAETYPFMADEIKWQVIGREELIGRTAVIDQCDKAAKFLGKVATTDLQLKIYRAETCVIVEGAAQFQDNDNQASGVASCDIFRFSDGLLTEITSYVIDLKD